MARADLSNLLTEDSKPLEQPQPAAKAAPAVAAASVPADRSEAPQGRINFEISRAKRAAFKAWCAQNDTSIRDELTAHIDRLIEG